MLRRSIISISNAFTQKNSLIDNSKSIGGGIGNVNKYYYCTANTNKDEKVDVAQLKKNVLEYKRSRDQVLTAYNDKFRFSIINLTKSANTAKTKHNLSLSDSQTLGKLMSGVSMCASFLSDEERISAQIISNKNPLNVYAEAIHVGEVRGYLVNGDEAPQDVDTKAIFHFSKILYGNLKPIDSYVEGGDLTISKEFQTYFDKSEQIPSYITLENIVSTETDSIEFNGGLVVQTLPFTTEKELEDLVVEIKSMSLYDLFVKEKKSLDEILDILSVNSKQKEPITKITNTIIDFFCRCSAKSFKSKLLTLGLDEVKYLSTHNHNQLNCIYCNKNYDLTVDDFKELIQILENNNNNNNNNNNGDSSSTKPSE
ncbi:hypothetical protein CYY_004610 [Polysphondylium violaceum]|uniref:Uncharacterized protein n=1 Tax=Polysphondylium violaceum TaxID=133409 RepID=A0A8J4Q522_9MYCE|nr:hypothetical protein CYY_004610 [Polysphondylium violaceum]